MLKTATGNAAQEKSLEEETYAKVTWRLIPFLFICYVFAYLDRVNVGFAKLQMLSDLKFSETVYGLGAGIFFIGYFIFEVPSNIALHKFGARKWIARIMITWGIMTVVCAFARTPMQLTVARFLLGVAEGGFAPGIFIYLGYWFPARWRAKAIATFLLGVPLAAVIGGPLSSAILSLHGLGGLKQWQWLFLLEGIPAVALGIFCLFTLKDSPSKAKWLSPGEKAWLESELQL